MKTIPLILASLMLFSCQSAPREGAPKIPDTPEAKADKLKEHELALEIARMKGRAAKLEFDQAEKEGKTSVTHAKTEVELAERELKVFEKTERPRKIEAKKLSVQSQEDSLQDALDELKQLEDMYKDGDLADKTREIVLARGKRRVDRAKAWLKLAKIELNKLEDFELPAKHARLVMTLEKKREALVAAEVKAQTGRIAKKIATLKAEQEIKKKEKALAEFKGEE